MLDKSKHDKTDSHRINAGNLGRDPKRAEAPSYETYKYDDSLQLCMSFERLSNRPSELAARRFFQLILVIGVIMILVGIYMNIQGNIDKEKHQNDPKTDICYYCDSENINCNYEYPCAKAYENAATVASIGFSLLIISVVFIGFSTVAILYQNHLFSREKRIYRTSNHESEK